MLYLPFVLKHMAFHLLPEPFPFYNGVSNLLSPDLLPAHMENMIFFIVNYLFRYFRSCIFADTNAHSPSTWSDLSVNSC